MANYYVDPSKADDSGAGTSPATAKKTIDGAHIQAYSDEDPNPTINLMAGTYNSTTQGSPFRYDFDFNNQDEIIQPYEGAEITITFDDEDIGIEHAANGNLEFKDLTLVITGTNGVGKDFCLARRTGEYASGSLIFTDCSLSQDIGTLNFYNNLIKIDKYSSVSGSVAFTDCVFDALHTVLDAEDLDAVTFIRCSGTGRRLCLLNGEITTLRIEDCDGFTLADTEYGGMVESCIIKIARSVVPWDGTRNQGRGKITSCDLAIIIGNTASCGRLGVHLKNDAAFRDVFVRNNAITLTGPAAKPGIWISYEYTDADAWSSSSVAYEIGDIKSNNGELFSCLRNHSSSAGDEPGTSGGLSYWAHYSFSSGLLDISHNTVDLTGDAAGTAHCMLMGFGCDDAEVAYNTVSNGNWGLVVKGTRNHVHHNTCYGANPLSIIAGQQSKVHNNTSVATSGYAIRSSGQSDNMSGQNHFYNNIAVGVGNDVGCFYTKAATDESDWLDFNCYYKMGTGNPFKIATNEYATFALYITAIQANSHLGYDQEGNSVYDDPRLADAANGDFQVLNSAVLDIGQPDVDGKQSAIGAVYGWRGRWSFNGNDKLGC